MLRKSDNNKINSIIGPQVEVDGDVKVVGSILIYGKINGSVKATGTVRSAKESHIIGDIESRDANISGKVDGDLNVENKTVLEKNCILNGNLTTLIVVVEQGATFKGLCNMGGAKDDNANFESPIQDSTDKQDA